MPDFVGTYCWYIVKPSGSCSSNGIEMNMGYETVQTHKNTTMFNFDATSMSLAYNLFGLT